MYQSLVLGFYYVEADGAERERERLFDTGYCALTGIFEPVLACVTTRIMFTSGTV